MNILDHGWVVLRNAAGPTGPARDIDVAQAARLSFDQMDSSRPLEDDMKLTRFLRRERHMTPFEHIEFWFEMKLPIFVARHLVRHRTATISEVSSRYRELEPHWYIPDEARMKPEDAKQGRGKLAPIGVGVSFRRTLDDACMAGFERYKQAIEDGIAVEQARLFLHVNHYTHWLYKIDLRNLLNLLDQRLAPGCEYETWAYAAAMEKLVRERLPTLMEAVRH